MLSLILLLVNVLVPVFGVLYFDYLPDGSINSPLIIILSIIIGTICMLLTLAFYIELFYYTIAKRKPINSMMKHKVAKQMIVISLHITHTRVKVIGIENLPKNPSFSIYTNHTSMFDIPVLMYKLKDYPIAFLAKEVVGKIFSIGKWIEPLGCVLIDRSNDRKGAEAIIKVIRNVKGGSSMVIFPEGTRSPKADELLPFKPGAFKVALKSKAPLVPVTIIRPSGRDKKRWPLPKRVTVIIHKPIPFDEFKVMKSQELSDYVEGIIKKPIDEKFNK